MHVLLVPGAPTIPMEYLAALIALLAATLLLQRVFRVRPYATVREGALTTVITFAVGVAWDSVATLRGHWTIASDRTIGLTVGVLPIEEYLFMLVVPYFVLTVAAAVRGRRG